MPNPCFKADARERVPPEPDLHRPDSSTQRHCDRNIPCHSVARTATRSDYLTDPASSANSRPSTGTARSGALRPAAVFGAVGGMEAVRLQGEPRPRPPVVSPRGAQPASISSARNPASRSAS